jgi:hypothetical protein
MTGAPKHARDMTEQERRAALRLLEAKVTRRAIAARDARDLAAIQATCATPTKEPTA